MHRRTQEGVAGLHHASGPRGGLARMGDPRRPSGPSEGSDQRPLGGGALLGGGDGHAHLRHIHDG